jgi:phage terminase large subunit-like protein
LFFHGDDGIIEAGSFIRELAATFEIVELVHDPWRAQQLALELEHEGMVVVTFPQTVPRLVPMSERLHRAVVERRITHPNDPELNLHVANAIAKDGPRGWRLDKPSRSALIDGVIACGMAVERAEARPTPVQLLGWL